MNTQTRTGYMARTPHLGEMRIPRVTNLRTASRRAPDLSPVTRATRAWLGLGEELIAALAPMPVGNQGGALPDLLEDAVERLASKWYREGLVRRGLRQAAAAAVTTVGHLRPADRVFCGPAYTAMAAERDLPVAALMAQPDGARLAWWSPAGGRSALLVDRLHHTHRAGLVLDDWMRQQVAADLARGRAVAGNEFDGVRVIAHMAYASCVHVLPDFSHHILGQCPKCTVQPWGGA